MKKRIFSFLLAALMVVSLLPTVAFAATDGSGTKGDPWLIGTPTADSVTAYVDGTTLHIEGTGEMQDFTFSHGEANYPWINYVDKITTVVIGSGVTYIGDYALKDCSKLTSVKMPYVTSIGDYALQDCNHLTSVEMPRVETIGDSAFKDCHCLTSVEMPSVNFMGANVFNKCEKLTSADIGSSITNLDGTFKLYGTFDGCSNLNSVVIRAVKPPIIENFTFSGCTALTEIIVPAASEADYKDKWSGYKAGNKDIKDIISVY